VAARACDGKETEAAPADSRNVLRLTPGTILIYKSKHQSKNKVDVARRRLPKQRAFRAADDAY
jgi:hypothetical protein